MASNYPINFQMVGSGVQVVDNIAPMYNFLSVINNTDNTVTVYNKRTTNPDGVSYIMKVQPFTQRTIPVNQRDTGYTFAWIDGGSTSAKKLEAYLSEDNLGLNSQLGGTIYGDINLVTDSVGLARMNQLPSSLESGALKVHVVNSGSGPTPASESTQTAIKGDTGSIASIAASMDARALTTNTKLTDIDTKAGYLDNKVNLLLTGQGTAETSVVPGPGGAGVLGFLSGCYRLLASLVTTFAPPSLPVHTAGTITAADTSQTAIAGNTNRKFLLFINKSDTDMYITISDTNATVANGIPVKAGERFYMDRYASTKSVRVICSASGKAYTVVEG